MTCFVTEGDTPVTIFWSFEGSKLVAEEGVSFISVGLKGSLLVIDPVTEERTGNYSCTAENAAGSVVYGARLAVNGS